MEEPAGWVAAKAKSGTPVFKLVPEQAPVPEPEPQPAPVVAPAQLPTKTAPETEAPKSRAAEASAAQAAAQIAQEQAAAAAAAVAKQEQEKEAAAAAAVSAAAKATSAAVAAAARAPAAAPVPSSLTAPAPAPLGLPPAAAAPSPSVEVTASGHVDTKAIEAQTRAQMQPLAERLTVSMRLLSSKRPAEPYAFLATAFRRYALCFFAPYMLSLFRLEAQRLNLSLAACMICSPDDAKSEPARSAPASDHGEQTLVAYLESHSVIRNMRSALELCLRQEPPLATEQALQFVAAELAKLAR